MFHFRPLPAVALLCLPQSSALMIGNVGRIAQKANVKKRVLSHFVPADDPLVTDQVWRDTVGKTYQGPIVVGHDGMEIDLND